MKNIYTYWIKFYKFSKYNQKLFVGKKMLLEEIYNISPRWFSSIKNLDDSINGENIDIINMKNINSYIIFEERKKDIKDKLNI